MSHLVQITQSQFEAEVLNSKIPVVVDFYADWCPPCRALAPILNRLASEFEGRIKFVKVNSDHEQQLAEAFNVTGLPTVVMIKDGQIAGQFSGLPREEALRTELENWIGTRTTAAQ